MCVMIVYDERFSTNFPEIHLAPRLAYVACPSQPYFYTPTNRLCSDCHDLISAEGNLGSHPLFEILLFGYR